MRNTNNNKTKNNINNVKLLLLIHNFNYEFINISQCSTIGVTKAVVCVILSMGVVHIKDTLLLISKNSPGGDGNRFHRY